MLLGQSDFHGLQEDERAQFVIWIFGWLRVLEQAQYFHNRGYLDEDIWLGHVAHLAQIMKSEGVQGYWRDRKRIFNRAFQELVEAAIVAEQVSSMPVDLVRRGSA